jgi:hypothetical protein
MKKNSTSAFTIVEAMVSLLTVAALGVLAFSVVGVSGKIRDDMTCISNLRQIGVGILTYTGDHNGFLPGPLLIGQFPYLETSYGGDSKALATHLEDYLAIIKSQWKTGGDVFRCPANRRLVISRPQETPVFMVNTEVPMNGRVGPQAPFGYPNKHYANYRYNLAGGILRDVVIDKNGNPQDELPVNLTALDQIVDAQGHPARNKTWAVKDVDQLEKVFEREKSSYRTRLPKKMAHGSHRNALFFDFRVGRVDELNQPL